MARFRAFLLIGACLPLAACEPVAIALLGAGASTAIRYNMDMGLTQDGTIPFDSGETIYAKARHARAHHREGRQLPLRQRHGHGAGAADREAARGGIGETRAGGSKAAF